jgi:zinc/manganese transport system substrate-binding protein
MRKFILALAAALVLAVPGVAPAQDKVAVVVTFSILEDLVRQVGGDRVAVDALVGRNHDAHVYQPSPSDSRKLGAARLVVSNGLGFEGWIDRLVKASGTKAALAVASQGIRPRRMQGADAHGHDHGRTDPHAWQTVGNVKTYVANIRDALSRADPAGQASYAANAEAYLGRLDALEAEVKAAIAAIPADRRKVITTHDSFGYFSAAYGVDFIAPQGVSTDTEASARDVARIITQVKRQKIPAVFIENVSDERLLRRIAEEGGARVGGKLYSDALSDPAGPAGSYVDMMRHNAGQLRAALAQ